MGLRLQPHPPLSLLPIATANWKRRGTRRRGHPLLLPVIPFAPEEQRPRPFVLSPLPQTQGGGQRKWEHGGP